MQTRGGQTHESAVDNGLDGRTGDDRVEYGTEHGEDRRNILVRDLVERVLDDVADDQARDQNDQYEILSENRHEIHEISFLSFKAC